MFTTRNGKQIEFVVASGALGWFGDGWPWEKPLVKLGAIDPSLFTITTKTLTRYENKGNWLAVCPVKGGVWNNMGLPNHGFLWWRTKYRNKYKCKLPYKTLVSIAPNFASDANKMVYWGMIGDDLEYDPNFVGYEINVSCPNTKKLDFERILDIVKKLESGTEHIYALILKLNYQQAFYSEGFTEKQLLELLPLVDAISLNSAPKMYGKGAYSGKIAQEYNWATADYLQSLGFKVIWPSLWEYEDIDTVISRKAAAVSFGAIHLLRPWAPTQWIRRYLREKNSVSNVSIQT